MAQYVALLRGINVGGNRKIPMVDLRAALEVADFDDVRTYIQSGNVLLRSTGQRATIEGDVERVIEEQFGFAVTVVVRSHRQLRSVVAKAPAGFGEEPDRYHSDAIFLKAPLTPARAMQVFDPRAGVDEVTPGTGVIYSQRVSAQRTKSRLNKIVATPEYQLMTIRSWTTTTKLLALLDT